MINTASIQYTTLPGSRSTPISPYNPNSVERTGNPADPGGSANNLNASGSASFTPTPTITKVLIGTNQPFTTGNSVAIGETAQYGVTITIPEGVSPSAIFTDQLPNGLAIASLDQLVASPPHSRRLWRAALIACCQTHLFKIWGICSRSTSAPSPTQ